MVTDPGDLEKEAFYHRELLRHRKTLEVMVGQQVQKKKKIRCKLDDKMAHKLLH